VEGDAIRLTTAVGELTLPLLTVVAADGTPFPPGDRPLVQGNEILVPFASPATPPDRRVAWRRARKRRNAPPASLICLWHVPGRFRF